MEKAEYSEKEREEIGETIAEIFKLRKNREGLYSLTWGTKTARGVYEVFVRIAEGLERGKHNF